MEPIKKQNCLSEGEKKNPPFLAHIRPDLPDKANEQTLHVHSRNTANYAAQVLIPVNLSSSGYLAGLVHDAGKYTRLFQRYLRFEEGTRGSVNHTFAGVRLLLERYFNENTEDFSSVVSELLSLASGGHHGLFDCIGNDQKNGFQHRLTKEGISYEEAVQNFLLFCTDWAELDRLFQSSVDELTPLLNKICSMTDEKNPFFDDETAFYAGLLSRLLLSAVIEGDRRDTAEFMNDSHFPASRNGNERKQLWAECLTRAENKLSSFPKAAEIDRARWSISDQCRERAVLPSGVFRLNVPTGGGKTLASLRFALAHAKHHKMQRIIFTSPLLSILEQNASVIRDYIQDDSLILEHHSNLIRIKDDPQELDTMELLTENWDAPIILTTLVQLLNTLFSGKTTAIRRFHALCGSIIVIDEVQSVPNKMLSLFSLAVNFLAEICGATVVLCSATQPCIEKITHPLHMPVPDLVPFSADLWSSFQRTNIQYIGELFLDEVAQFALEKLQTSILIVCNKKQEAEQLFQLLNGGDFDLFQLSAAMCVQHRRNTLEALQKSLKTDGRKTICVSTQVIEAGVDISFACVIRLTAGMDSVIQAAGRCNRNGEAGSGVLAPVYLVGLLEENLSMLPDIQRGKAATLELLTEFKNRPELYGRLDSDRSIEYYYHSLYHEMPKQNQDYVWHNGDPSLFSLLSLNGYCEKETPYYFRQAFRLASSVFQVFEESTTDVIVPYDKGQDLILSLNSGQAEWNPAYLKKLLEDAKPYTVSLYQYQIDYLEAEHGIIPLPGGALGLNGHYSAETGFIMEDTHLDFLGVT